MAKKKEPAIISAFKLFFEGTKLYFKHIDKFLKYMLFPVLGQILGIVLIFTTIHLFVNNIDKIISINPVLDNVSVMMMFMVLLTVPSFMIFFAAFWKYLIALGALNSMANNLVSSAKLEDLNLHNDVVNRRMPTFLSLVLILSVISVIGAIPILWVILLVIMIYLCLCFQIFALEENLNVIEIVKKSVRLVKGNFIKTTILLFLLWLLTYNFLPSLICYGFEKLSLFKYLCIPVKIFSNNLPLADVQNTIQSILTALNSNVEYTLNATEFSKSIVINLTGAAVIGLTLPLRSICCTLLYKNLETKKLKEKKIKEL